MTDLRHIIGESGRLPSLVPPEVPREVPVIPPATPPIRIIPGPFRAECWPREAGTEVARTDRLVT